MSCKYCINGYVRNSDTSPTPCPSCRQGLRILQEQYGEEMKAVCKRQYELAGLLLELEYKLLDMERPPFTLINGGIKGG